MVNKDEITEEDSQFVIIPVSVNTENTSAYSSTVFISDIVPYVETPVMAKLLLNQAKIKFTFSKQTVIF